VPGLELEFAQVSDPGNVRPNNEDYCGCALPASPAQAQSHGWIFVLADGVGGHERGEVASRTAVESILANFRNSSGAESHVPLMRRLVQAANQEVYQAGRSAGPGGVAMATTIVTCSLRYDRAVVAHVGDSRCYLVRNGAVTALTQDHSVSAEQMRLGIITAKEASQSAHRNLLSRSLGNDLFVNVDISDHLLVPGDIMLLCSDGFYASIEPADMIRLLAPDSDLSQATSELAALAKGRDGHDNLTVQTIRIRNTERIGIYRGRPYRLR
jgi:protein phosphatase